MSSININYKLGIILFISTLGAHSSWAQQDTVARNIQQQGQVTSAYSVKGTVYDSQTNKPIAGARITYGSNVAKLTDSKGNFRLELPVSNAIVEVSLDGYIAKQVPVLLDKSMKVVLYPDGYRSFYKKTETVFGDNGVLNYTGAVDKLELNAWEQNS